VVDGADWGGAGGLERDDISLHHLDGADFARVQGVRREHIVSACASANEGQCIVTDERRGSVVLSDCRRQAAEGRAKGARPSGVVAGRLSDSVTLLDRTTSPLCARFLAEMLPATIKMMQTNVIPL
jgi:hypothetical protein